MPLWKRLCSKLPGAARRLAAFSRFSARLSIVSPRSRVRVPRVFVPKLRVRAFERFIEIAGACLDGFVEAAGACLQCLLELSPALDNDGFETVEAVAQQLVET